MRPHQDPATVKTVAATLSLVRRGLTMLRAKRIIEVMLDKGRAVVMLPAIEDPAILGKELAEHGVRLSLSSADSVDVKALREQASDALEVT